MRSVSPLFLVLLLASPGWAQDCETKVHGRDDIRVQCKGGGSYGARHNPDGTIDEFRHGRSLKTLGLVPTWNANRLDKKPPAPDLDPITPSDVVAEALADPALVLPMADTATVVMMSGCLWTPRAEAAQGGASAMLALCTWNMATATAAYQASGVNAELRLGLAQRIEYVEGNINQDLGRLSTPATLDTYLNEVHVLRNQYALDVITLIGEGYAAAGACGLGYYMPAPQANYAAYAFNVVDRTCAGAYLSYVHEVGHNQGLAHDPANATVVAGAYNYGYQDPGGAFRTVLAYGSATRIPRLSSATLLYNGKPTGTATQDNARRLILTAPTVAAFRMEPLALRQAVASVTWVAAPMPTAPQQIHWSPQ